MGVDCYIFCINSTNKWPKSDVEFFRDVKNFCSTNTDIGIGHERTIRFWKTRFDNSQKPCRLVTEQNAARTGVEISLNTDCGVANDGSSQRCPIRRAPQNTVDADLVDSGKERTGNFYGRTERLYDKT